MKLVPPDDEASPLRCASIDYLRIAAAFGIVWFHVMEAPARVVAYAALPVFVILTLMLPLLRNDPLSFSQITLRRARRLLLPWAVWYAVYAGFAMQANRPIVEEADLGGLLYGPALHLWFLPFAFVAGVLTELVGPRLVREPVTTAVLSPVLGCVLVWFATQQLDHLDDPWVQFALAGSFVPFAIGLAAAQRLEDQRLRRNALALIALLPAVTATGLWHAGLDTFDAVSTALGIAAVAFILSVRLPSRPIVRRLGMLTMGVYLIHPIAFGGVYSFVQRPAWWVLIAGGFGGAVIAAVVLRSHPLPRRIFFGETPRSNTAARADRDDDREQESISAIAT